jgi:hypothetical protein
MSAAQKLVPLWARGLTVALALANLGYGVMGYLRPGEMFAGLDAGTATLQNAVYQFSARNIAIGIALLIVGLVGVPESIAIVMIIRFLIEAQDLVLGVMFGAPPARLAMAAAFMAVEGFVIVTMFRIVAKRDALQSDR